MNYESSIKFILNIDSFASVSRNVYSGLHGHFVIERHTSRNIYVELHSNLTYLNEYTAWLHKMQEKSIIKMW